MSDSHVVPCPHCDGLSRVPSNRLHDQPQCGRCKQPLLGDAPFTLSQTNYPQQIKGDVPLLVDVWAAWCGPCQGFAPTFNEAAKQYQGRCRLAKLDSDQHPNLSAQLRIRSIPSLILFKNGAEVARKSGAMSLTQLNAWLHQYGL